MGFLQAAWTLWIHDIASYACWFELEQPESMSWRPGYFQNLEAIITVHMPPCGDLRLLARLAAALLHLILATQAFHHH